ncbi:MAG: hypothetical protein LBG74_01140 [Spirochaetaceae bacterium]|nr:hypothetical protein [Spirochaetaceae bacterium]
MKKNFIMVLMAVLTLFAASCASGNRAAKLRATPMRGVPAFVNDAYLSASNDVIIGIGTFKMGDDMSKMSMAKTMAETRARADIGRQIQTIVKNMVTDYTSTSELDPKSALSFQENITQALVKADLRGARTLRVDRVDGILWLIMEYNKKAASEDCNAAVSAAKLAVPAAASFDAVSRMENAFDKTAGGGPSAVVQ